MFRIGMSAPRTSTRIPLQTKLTLKVDISIGLADRRVSTERSKFFKKIKKINTLINHLDNTKISGQPVYM